MRFLRAQGAGAERTHWQIPRNINYKETGNSEFDVRFIQNKVIVVCFDSTKQKAISAWTPIVQKEKEKKK